MVYALVLTNKVLSITSEPSDYVAPLILSTFLFTPIGQIDLFRNAPLYVWVGLFIW